MTAGNRLRAENTGRIVAMASGRGSWNTVKHVGKDGTNDR
ncbi:hypothetical protein DSM100238_1071 [Bifidobacterium apri]|uniref:Uncharacterized protein n=1 Tax=Bifidobacterium apri TaxID=1769423 RepID=A0A6A2V8X6_9BIFI|nr:hypothetical protein DSM100238_1071 [Bifidobacterium apri]